ncbi:putative colanic acid biosynthesis UDP-glucose lipid carrier transferase [Maribacter vaceletii]|uniref:Putative colanic acid biosynthesis UDP-glucose lipid carrier transferase n=1 Tax=Maribacter vaceletii TaxID=1206816 RepID=A0A495EFS4_9FLAO|nr:exopolysaccharide biosynthesis polyprenyl glycosylphosphotransferase [Maribacter vaceletii]RKR14767.1 putative colanic acid biosynthesis UDP-glucose lipid carrier transferase [Maribacter vaceletii]
MLFKQHRFSGYITPIFLVIDLLVINLFAYYMPINFQTPILFHSYLSLSWILLSYKNEFYKIYRYSKVVYILRKLFNQFVFFGLLLYAFIGFFKQPNMSRLAMAQYFGLILVSIGVIKFLNYLLLMKYRKSVKGNIRRVVVIGKNKKTDQLIEVFQERTEFGFQFVNQFDPKRDNFDPTTCYRFIVDNKIDEVYCSVSELGNEELTGFINFADNNLKTLKFLPDNKNIFSKKLKFEYYDYLPILSLRDIPLHTTINAFLKRTFDIVFSLIVIFGLLIWIGPILAILIRLESKGPVFFIQKRTGFDNKEFQCFKFRSMGVNNSSDAIQAGKNDMRVTKIGKFIRRTSIDELPQFYNVFFGNMSIVGPRPHMLKHTNEYANTIDKYMLRHFVKPGITGLAQVRGYRGEIEKKSDIQNRIRFDIFYVENWSFIMDIKIIIQTIINAIRGEEKAY